MSLQTRITDFATAVGTDYKQLRTWISGSSTGDLTGLSTTAKTSVIAAINEVNGKTASVPAATETTAGIAQVATQAETTAGTIDTDMVTPLKLQQKLTAWAQPLSANLTTLAGVASSAIGRSILAAADAAAVKTLLSLVKADVGLGNVPNVDATARANHTGTQPVASITGLAAIATSGSASDLTTGTLPTSVMPSLAINDVFVVASQAAMLALTAQRGDIAKRTDLNGQTFVLQADAPTVLANWIALDTTNDVSSVNGQTGTVVLAKADVGLGNVDNTSDVNKPVSTAQAAADALALAKASNLSDLANAATARTNLGAVWTTDIGNPDTDLVAAYTAAKA
jgi:hypothetical protein